MSWNYFLRACYLVKNMFDKNKKCDTTTRWSDRNAVAYRDILNALILYKIKTKKKGCLENIATDISTNTIAWDRDLCLPTRPLHIIN